eukprot:TRINITY_DN15710_c0_g1_i1.p1 TRINITY_DN15710_c0_g1~~TRINITY_DN15710_c0_g1_i1.p1  ORF type:complete len:280 (+),score=45.88 TRINITY_DN15710_c0_g1_i1:3-842(+)
MILVRFLVSFCIAFFMSYRGYKKKSLDLSGALSAFFVGIITFYFSINQGIMLLTFFITSSYLTKMKSKVKEKLEDDFKEGGQRNVVQVFANSSLPVIFSFVGLLYSKDGDVVFDQNNFYSNFATLCALGYYSCCCGDTWSSELGILSPHKPILITNFKNVHPGTNGGVTIHGLLGALGGGLIIGISSYFTHFIVTGQNSPTLIFVGTFAGVCGSLLDSLLGATLQYSGYCSAKKRVVEIPSSTTQHISGIHLLDNHMVNLFSASIVSLIVPFFFGNIFV